MKKPKSPKNELTRLEALGRYRILDTPAEPAFDELTQLVASLLDVPIALVTFVDADRQWFKSRVGLSVSETPRDISFCGHVVELDEPLIVEDATRDERFADNPLVAGPPNIKFYAGFPLRTPDGFVLGTVCAIDQRTHRMRPGDIETLEILARQAVDRLEVRLQARMMAEQAHRLSSVLNTAVDAIITIDESGVIDEINPAGERLFGYNDRELIGRNVRILMPEDLRKQHDRGMKDYLLTGHKKVIGIGRELLGKRQDGTTFPIDAVVSEMWIGDARMFTGILRDATLRKDNERRLNESLADLKESRENLLQVLNLLKVATLVTDNEGTIEFASDGFWNLSGLEAHDLKGQFLEDLFGMSDKNRQLVRSMMRLPEEKRSRLEIQLLVGKQSRRWVEIDLRDDPRDPARKIIFIYDLSDVHELRHQLGSERSEMMIGDSNAMRTLLELISKVAVGDWTVLVEGETGAGKELVARAIHAASSRREGPFIPVNCAGLTDSLLGSQLFGHIKGSFTGAISDQKGLFEAASGGTLFLDEIGDISPTLQASLLRVLQEKEITRLGESRPRKIDVRIVAATNRDLSQRVKDGHFREDLLYRIRSGRVRVPSLRERRDDIPLLVASFLARERLTSGKLVTEIAAEAQRRLVSHDWPGNVRELRAAVEYAVMRCRSNRIEVADLPPEILVAEQAPPDLAGDADERTRIVDALSRAEGNRARAARLLGVGRATLYRRLRELEIGDKE